MSARYSFFQTSTIRIRLSLVICTFAVIAVGMLVRSTYLQIIGDPKLERLAERQFQSHVSLTPRRGMILDRSGEPFAINLETSSLAGNPQKLLKSPETTRLLAKALGTTSSKLRRSLNSRKFFHWLDRHISDHRLEKFKKYGIILPNGNLPDGLWLVKEMKRVYPHGRLASSLIGSVNIDTDGLEGVELWKNSHLRGKSASFDAFKDALGRPALYNTEAQSQMRDGESVELSIDASLQFSIEELVEESMAKTQADAALVIAMNSNTGEILALAQNTAQRQRIKKSMALTDGYEPGSTLKPLLLAIALDSGAIKMTDHLFGHYGKFKIQNRTISEAESHEKFGYIDMKTMVEVSSNIVASELALKVGARRYLEGLKKFGFGQRTGTGFPGEISGWLPSDPSKIKPLTLATMGFGQSFVSSPIQILRAYAAISNGGYRVQPTLLKHDEDAEIERIQILKPETVKGVTQALIAATQGKKGTGTLAQVQGYQIAGKTGTAQTVDPKTKGYSHSRYIASFVGFPAGVSQPVTLLAWIDNPKGIYYAGQTAAPLFSKSLQALVSRFSIPATEEVELKLTRTEQSPSSSEEIQMIQSSAQIALLSELSAKEVNLDHPVMPSLTGLTPQEALQVLKPFAPKVSVHGFGLIQKQKPESGTVLENGVSVSLYLND